MPLIHRRALLRGLFAAPAIVAAGSLMPIRGVKLITVSSLTELSNFIFESNPTKGENWVYKHYIRTPLPDIRWRKINEGIEYAS